MRTNTQKISRGNMSDYTTIRVRKELKKEIEMACIEHAKETGELISWTQFCFGAIYQAIERSLDDKHSGSTKSAGN